MQTHNLWKTKSTSLKNLARKFVIGIFVVSVLFITNSCGAVLSSINVPPYKSDLTAPANTAVNIQTNVTLEWEASHDPEGKALYYNVYIDTNNPPQTRVAKDITDTYYKTSLKANTTYYWQVIVRDEGNSTNESDIWSFKTKRYNIKKK